MQYDASRTGIYCNGDGWVTVLEKSWKYVVGMARKLYSESISSCALCVQLHVMTNLLIEWLNRMPYRVSFAIDSINHLRPNGHYMGRTAQLTSRCCILYIYSTNIGTEYFKHAA